MNKLLLLSAIFLLAACGSSHPDPATEPAPDKAAEPDASLSENSAVPTVPHSPEEGLTIIAPDSLLPAIEHPCHPARIPAYDFRRLHHCADSMAQRGDFETAITLLQLQINARNNPDQLGRRTLQLAQYLDAVGRTREAGKVLEDFLVYKPTINEWMDSALALEAQFQKARQAKDQAYVSLVKQIRNLSAVQADYDQVRLLTDTLRSLQPGDSLVRWAKVQDELALQRSLEKIQKSTAQIRAMVQDRADFNAAREASMNLQVKYPGLVERAGLKDLHAWIESQQKLYGSDADAAYWNSRSPRDTLRVARSLLERKNYDEARIYYKQLLSSPLRKEARDDLELLSEAFCEDQRKIAADRFASSRRNPKNAAAQLDEAIAALDRCLVETPEGPVAEKVRQNRALLEQEKNRLGTGAP